MLRPTWAALGAAAEVWERGFLGEAPLATDANRFRNACLWEIALG